MRRGWKKRRIRQIRRRIAAAILFAAVTIAVVITVWAKSTPEVKPIKPVVEYIETGKEQAELAEVQNISVQEIKWQFEPLEELKLDAESQEYMYGLCRENNIPFSFAAMIMESESQFDPEALGDGCKSVGYFQINEVNWERMATEYGLDVFEPMDNIECGVVMLRELFEKYGDPYQVILCYKCGECRGNELFEQGVYTTIQFDCGELCSRAIEIERYMEE